MAKAKTKTKTQTSEKEKETQNMATVNVEDQIDMNDAEDFKQPSDGVHNGHLNNVEFGPTKAGDREQFTLTVVLSEEDPDSPNLPMRYYSGWPVPEDKEVMWGTRTAYGAKIKSIQALMTAFGGPESGTMKKNDILAFFNEKIGSPVKVKVKSSVRKDTGEMQANVADLLPA
jgi:hypothetical protein